eukprot:TRINITY_DN14576_c1_g1_i2.p1 TRINITY_DN14576_c1_g1~~TRINITY_DN14576_c1_g1_i2.p1  ORF type:complete len:459 (+),score=64.76 TRINITY_DN14576_c1_g1_i2:180-1379(+)
MVFYVSEDNLFGLGPHGGFNKTPGTTETMIGLIHLLYRTGSTPGAILVILYAIFIPALKLTLVLVGNCLARGKDPAEWGTCSRRCIQVVQNISKWACPDMFAYILLMHLVKSLNVPPNFFTVGRLDLGFTCFSLFCVGSTIAAIGIRVPDREHGWARRAGAMLGRRFILWVVLILEVAFFVLFCFGITQTVMALKVGKTGNDLIDQTLALLGLDTKLHSETSLVSAMQSLVKEIQKGEVNSLIGFFMISVFVIGFTALDMLALAYVAFLTKMGRTADGWMKIAWVVKKLSMLDVTCMGILVVILCMAMYRDVGVIVDYGTGLWILVAAEVVHYFTYYTVKGTVEAVEPKLRLGDPLQEDESDDEYVEASNDNKDDSDSCNRLGTDSSESSSEEESKDAV